MERLPHDERLPKDILDDEIDLDEDDLDDDDDDDEVVETVTEEEAERADGA